MKVYIGADHRGFALKEKLKQGLGDVDVIDMGAFEHQPTDDFVDFAKVVAQKVSTDTTARGVLICGSGAGMCIAANKVTGVRSSVGHSVKEVIAARHDDDINVLALPSDFVDDTLALEMVKAFLTTAFIPEERFVRRIAKIKELETHA
ncbi:MAG: RpiB/LacA/LacB family sugar-phosphate isomerase [Patescibacteria group bacterium]